MEGWANVKRHVAEEITLLCDRHHRERGSRLLPIEAVRTADKDPHNLQKGRSAAYSLHYSSTTVSVELGSNFFEAALDEGVRTLQVVVVDLEPLLEFRLEDGHVLLTLKVLDAFGRPLLSIVDNELCYSVAGAWDFQLTGRRLFVREATRRIFLDVEFAVPDRLIVRRGCLMRNGVQVDIEAGAISIANNGLVWERCATFGGGAALVVGEMPRRTPVAWHAPVIPRFRWQPSGVFALEP